MDTYCSGCEKGVEMHALILTTRRKHLDTVCKDTSTSKGPSCMNSVPGRVFSKMEKGEKRVVRPPNQTTCSDVQSGDGLVGADGLLGRERLMQPLTVPRAFTS